MERRDFLRGSLAAAGFSAAGAGLSGCAMSSDAAHPAAAGGTPLPSFDGLPALAPVRAHTERIFKITVCTRPFRAQGPRLDVEQIRGKTIVHNYGHGGSGWSLSWGSSTIAVGNALATGARDVAVIGCGALGLTSALLLQRAVARATIYAKDRPPDVRSSRATGTWSPDSRISLEEHATPAFAKLWEEMCRNSFRIYQSYLGLPGYPVEWTDRYALSDIPLEELRAKRIANDTIKFARLQPLVRDLTPPPQDLPPGSHPFPTAYAQRTTSMMFNIAGYARFLMTDFMINGGHIETREFHSPAEFAALKQKVVINATGYGARDLFRDETIIPVRGQLAWLIPQPEVTYGLSYGDVSMLSRRDGILFQAQGEGEATGFNDPSDVPDRAEAEAAVRAIAAVYAKMNFKA
jgi:FAD dependent oxidoreductase